METTGRSGDMAREGTPSRIGAMFGLDADEAGIVEDVCRKALAERGILADAFFERLGRGESIDVALGFPAELRDVLYGRAHRWFSIGRPERAEELFRALCVADPGDADYWVGLGVCQRLGENLAAARLSLDTAIALRPQWAVPRFHACELALRRGALDQAAAHLGAFRSLADEATPERMRAEAERLGEAILARTTAQTDGEAR